jgi:uncharacterized coiled-coil protein SlyX
MALDDVARGSGGEDEPPRTGRMREELEVVRQRAALLESRVSELQGALVERSVSRDALVARVRAVVDRELADTEREIDALNDAIAAVQASIFWRLKIRVANVLARRPGSRIRAG